MKRRNLNKQEFSEMIADAYKKSNKNKIQVKKFADAVSQRYSEYKKQAREYLNNAKELEKFLIRAEKKLQALPGAGKKLAYLPQMILMVRSYAIGEYKEVNKVELVIILAALIYFVSPLDIIPDTIPGVGFMDDALVAGTIMKMVQDDIDAYMDWVKEKEKEEKKAKNKKTKKK